MAWLACKLTCDESERKSKIYTKKKRKSKWKKKRKRKGKKSDAWAKVFLSLIICFHVEFLLEFSLSASILSFPLFTLLDFPVGYFPFFPVVNSISILRSLIVKTHNTRHTAPQLWNSASVFHVFFTFISMRLYVCASVCVWVWLKWMTCLTGFRICIEVVGVAHIICHCHCMYVNFLLFTLCTPCSLHPLPLGCPTPTSLALSVCVSR